MNRPSLTTFGAGASDLIPECFYTSYDVEKFERCFSETNIKYSTFYDTWMPYVNRQPSAGDLEESSNALLLEIRQPMAGDLDWNEFLAISFSHHMEIISNVKVYEERIVA